MGNYKRSLRKKLVRGSGVMRVFGSSYKYKEVAKELRKSMRRGQKMGKRKMDPLKQSTPFMRFLHPLEE